MQALARELLDALWQRAAGSTAPTPPTGRSSADAGYSAKPYVYDPVPRRDERFQDLYNQGVNAESFLYNPELPRPAEDADDALQAAARDRRAGDDGEHHHADQGQAVGLLSRHVAAALGRGPARHDGRGRLRRPAASTGPRPASRTTGRCGSTPNARRSSGTRCSTSSSRA